MILWSSVGLCGVTCPALSLLPSNKLLGTNSDHGGILLPRGRFSEVGQYPGSDAYRILVVSATGPTSVWLSEPTLVATDSLSEPARHTVLWWSEPGDAVSALLNPLKESTITFYSTHSRTYRPSARCLRLDGCLTRLIPMKLKAMLKGKA
jgi:hypothetical protein